MTSTFKSIVGSILILISTLCLAFILSHYTESTGWMDFTENKRYSLTDGTKNILDKVNRPLKAKLFYSKAAVAQVGTDQLKQFTRAYIYARDLLRVYERASGGKLEFLEFDPESFSDEAEEAAELGIRIVPLTDNLTFAFGLAVTSDSGAKEVLPFIDAREEGLFEHKITKLIERASKKEKKKVGILSALPMVGEDLSPEMENLRRIQGKPPQPTWNIVQWLRKDFEVETILPSAKTIPNDVEFLIVVHPKDFSDEILYAVDQYVMGGGKLIAFADPYCNYDMPMNTQGNPYAQFTHPRASDLNRLTKAWGVTMEKGKIIGDRAIAGMAQNNVQLMPYCVFVEKNDSFNKDEPVTQALDSTAKVVMYHAGSLKKVDGTPFEVSPLVMTTDGAGTRPFSSVDSMRTRQDPSLLWKPTDAENKDGFELAGEKLYPAVRISGKLKSAFPAGMPNVSNGDTENPESEKKEKEALANHLAECKDSNDVLLFADADILGNDFTYPPTSFFGSPLSNKAILYNALDYLGGSSDLISIRSRGSARREFDLIMAIRRDAAERTGEQEAAIQKEIDAYQKELTQLNEQATSKNAGVLRGEALKKERETKLKILKKKKELNNKKRESNIEVEAVKSRAKTLTTWGMPALVALIGLVLWILRLNKTRRKMREDMA